MSTTYIVSKFCFVDSLLPTLSVFPCIYLITVVITNYNEITLNLSH